MTPEEFKDIQRNLGLKNKELAEKLKVSVKAVESWRAGNRAIPGPVEVCLGFFLLELGEKQAGMNI